MMSNPINFLDEMANFTFTSKYARYDEKKKRRETWLETVSRVEQMHLKKFKSLSKEDKDQISAAFDLVREKRVIPSMRSMQFGGKAIEAKHPRLYNCGVRHIDSIRSFAESFFILLCGTGVGFGLTDKFLNRLPDLVTEKDKTGTVITYVVLDTIEGWADSIEALLTCYFKNTAFSGRKIVFDYSKIRPKGAKIKTGGGKAPGYKGLKNCHGKVKKLLDCIIEEKGQTRLKTVDAYDILMHCADAVLSGGSRRSACSIIFDANDQDMMNSKTGNWFSDNPQRARSNNSAIIVRKGTSFESFSNLIEKTKEFGEPGFLYVENEDQLLNPCFSIDTKILTEDGWRSFDNLLSNKEINILQDKRIKGVLVDNKEEWVLDLDADKGLISNTGTNIQKTGENKDIFELFLKCGRSVKATKDHLFATKRGMVQLGDLTKDDYVLIGVNDSHVADKESEDFKTAFLMGLWYGDGCSTDTGAIIDLWTSVENDPILARTENYIEYLINKNANILSFRTNVDKKPKFNKASGFIVGNVPKYRLCSSLLKQIFKLNGTDSKNGGDWLHSKNKDFKSGFLSGLFYCDGHTEYNRKAKTLSIRLGSINLDLLKNIQLILQELGSFSRINLNKAAGVGMLPDSNRVYKEYKTKTCYRLIIGGLVNCLNSVQFLELHNKDKSRIEMALSVSKKKTSGDYTSKVLGFEYVGKQDVYCLKEDNRRTLIAEGMVAKRCFEISFIPITKDGRCGYQFCNLSSVNGAKIKTFEELKKAVWAAALIGTLQTSYTDFPYLGHASEELTKEEALLGVSITGMMDNVDVLFNAENQREAAKVSVETNIEWAKKIGVNQAARVNCIKPEGTSSIVLSASSGIHPHHARRYFRRIQVNKEDNVYKFFKMYNDHACEESVWSANKVDDVITFPIEINENAKIKSELSAIEHLQLIKKTQSNWVNTGTTSANTKPLNHSVSCTVIVKDDEWAEVTKYLFNNQEYFTAVSLLPHSGDKIYQQAPMEAVVTPEDEAKFNKLKELWTKIDYTKLIEEDDETTLAQEAACAGGKCLTTF